MNKIDRYIQAATRDNTRRSYQSAIEHYEVTWGGFLPATADSIARYLADYADTLAVNTLKARLAGLAQWHIDQGFPDPTKAPVVKKVLKGIKELHPVQEKQAKPLQLEALNQVVSAIDAALIKASNSNGTGSIHRLLRNKALILIGFWRGFRSDELSRLRVEHIQVVPGEGMTLYLPRSKGDRQNDGQLFKAPALSRLCPVSAYIDWLHAADIQDGPVFRRIDRWGCLADKPLNPNSIITLLRTVFKEAGIAAPESYSSHSLRRGFATWANGNGWDVKSLMEYVGWKDMKSAMRYIDSIDHYAKQKIESSVQQSIG
ncbi:MAG: Tn3 family resolvase [Cellvibrionaceae bacterium]|nr:Tn3 family resolvase [Cellvibrionaceae bacterium]|tara:strand:+ start:2036 stop:2983 length:948 start_codon:yes stop_codon:yes gene_type:complete